MTETRCPFLARVEAGDTIGATLLALTGDHPVKPASVPQLLQWAREVVDTDALELEAGTLTRADLADHGFPP